MTMFPVTTLQEALHALERAFDCQAHVQDAVDVLYHNITVITDVGALYRDGDQVGTFAVARAKCRSKEQVVDIRVGAVGELCSNQRTWLMLEDWIKTLGDYFALNSPE